MLSLIERTFHSRVLAGLALVATLSACGSSNPAPAVDGGAVLADGGSLADGGATTDAGTLPTDAGTSAEPCRAYWTMACTAWHDCPASGEYFGLAYESVAACITERTAACSRFVVPPADLGALSVPFSQLLTGFAACTAALGRLPACDIFYQSIAGANHKVVPECVATVGTRSENAPCRLNDECRSTFCRYSEGCSRCTPPLGQVGDPCENTGCVQGLACHNGTCTRYANATESCDADTPCIPTLACIGGTCQAQLADMAVCDPRGVGNPCRTGYCNNGRCQRFTQNGRAGDYCGVDPNGGEVSICQRGVTCAIYDQQYHGVCVAQVPVGGRCFFDDGFQGGQCLTGSTCLNNTCVAFPTPLCSADGGPVTPPRDGGLPPRDGGAAELTAAQREASLTCDALFGCPRAAAFATALVGSRAECDASVFGIGGYNLAAPGAGFSATNLTACADALAALSACDRLDAQTGFKDRPAACVISGTLARGTVCAAESQCVASTRCISGVVGGGTTCGACSALAGDGGICVANEDCTTGLQCGNGRCIPGVGMGSTCSATAPCQRPLVCQGGTCAERGASGAPCSQGGAGGDTCQFGVVCNGTTNLCESIQLATLAAPDGGVVDGGASDGGASLLGAACGVRNGSLVVCPRPLQCRLTNVRMRTGVCDVAFPVGAACTWKGGLDGRGSCLFPGVCDRDNLCRVGEADYCQ